jgi:hypothetical protein
MSQKIYFFLLFFFFCFSLFAQKINIDLKNYPIDLKEGGFYISKVLDNRNDTTKVGWSVLDKDTRGNVYVLKGGTSNALVRYFNTNLKRDTNQVPLVLNLVSLMVTERAKGMREGKARVAVQFLRENEGMFGKVYEASSYTETLSEFGKDIYTTHERRIRAVLNQCLKNLSQSRWMEVKPDYISAVELKEETGRIDTLSKLLADTTGLFNRKKAETVVLSLDQIQFKGGVLPSFVLNKNKAHTLWAFKKYFKQLNEAETNKLYADYKSKFKLSFLVLGIGAIFVGASFSDDSVEDTGLPNLSLAVPGAVFAACSVPIYIKTNKLARKTVERYNVAIENK